MRRNSTDRDLKGNQQNDLAGDRHPRRADVAEARNQQHVRSQVEDQRGDECPGQEALPVGGDQHVLGEAVGVTQWEISDEDRKCNGGVRKVVAASDDGDDRL